MVACSTFDHQTGFLQAFQIHRAFDLAVVGGFLDLDQVGVQRFVVSRF